MMRLAAILFASALAAAPLPSPLSPADAVKAFEAAPGLRVELVAAEPLVASPCAIAFDKNGRLFVAENRGYPIGPKEGEKPAGVVALLEDTDKDGRMDKRTVFADGLTFPNGVLPWGGGLIVTCAPDVLYLKDNDGDGVADERRVLLTGFATTGSTQLRVNAPTIGPDGWIYLAAGLSGGTVTCPEHPERPPLKMTSDVRFHPKTLQVELVDGKSQYGMSFDLAGNRFICMNRVPVQHVVLKSEWLKRNPRLAFSETVQDCNERDAFNGINGGHDGVRLFPISSNITTADGHAGSFSAACGIKVWQGKSLLTPECLNVVLSCDPTGQPRACRSAHSPRRYFRREACLSRPRVAGLAGRLVPPGLPGQGAGGRALRSRHVPQGHRAS
jgi:putative membrane-bound dehydrogenase-like protein